ncbi:MAG: hypothetical protein DMG61_06270, partial [Acidobacteria bacterium]
MSSLSPERWQILSPYLDKGLELTDEERAAWLAALRSENPALVEELEVLLREHCIVREEGFLESSDSLSRPGAGLSGQTLGVYSLLAQVGQGGMGSVWLAERNDGRFERKVAVKFLN